MAVILVVNELIYKYIRRPALIDRKSKSLLDHAPLATIDSIRKIMADSIPGDFRDAKP